MTPKAAPQDDQPGEDRSPRALKAAEFGESAQDVDLEAQHGPIYDTLRRPRALKSARLLEQASEAPPLLEEERPALTPAVRAMKNALQADHAAFHPLEDAFSPQEDGPAEITQPTQPVKAPARPVETPAPVPHTRQRLLVAVVLAILIGLLVLIARLARNSAPLNPVAAPTATPAEIGARLGWHALGADRRTGPCLCWGASRGRGAEDGWRAQIETLTAADLSLRNALLSWLEAGQHSQTARLRLEMTCTQAEPDPDACELLQTDYDLWASRARLARNVVCIMTECPAA